jgi:hypothetical protein
MSLGLSVVALLATFLKATGGLVMHIARFVTSLAFACLIAVALVDAQGKPSGVPAGPPETPVEAPTTPPEGSTLVGWVCGWLPVPYLCD